MQRCNHAATVQLRVVNSNLVCIQWVIRLLCLVGCCGVARNQAACLELCIYMLRPRTVAALLALVQHCTTHRFPSELLSIFPLPLDFYFIISWIHLPFEKSASLYEKAQMTILLRIKEQTLPARIQFRIVFCKHLARSSEFSKSSSN